MWINFIMHRELKEMSSEELKKTATVRFITCSHGYIWAAYADGSTDIFDLYETPKWLYNVFHYETDYNGNVSPALMEYALAQYELKNGAENAMELKKELKVYA